MFALIVFNTMTDKISTDRLAQQLLDLVNRKLSLSPSPADAIAGMEAEVGRKMPENLRASVHRMLGDRADLDAANRSRAERILTMMGFDLV